MSAVDPRNHMNNFLPTQWDLEALHRGKMGFRVSGGGVVKGRNS